MCGIGAFIPNKDLRGDSHIVTNSIASLLLHNTARGSDSAGIAAITTTGRSRIIKRAMDPRAFMLQQDVNYAISKWIAKGDVVAWIIHTRAATTGAVTDINAHPFRCGAVTVVHNGWIYNHDDVATKKNLKLISQCDSEVIAAVMNYDPTYQKLAALCGEFAVIAHDARKANMLYLARATNPLWYKTGTPWGSYLSSQPLTSDTIVARSKRVLADRNTWTSLTQESAAWFDLKTHKLTRVEAPKWESTFLRSRDWRSEHGYYGSYGYYNGHYYRSYRANPTPVTGNDERDDAEAYEDYWHSRETDVDLTSRPSLFDPVSPKMLGHSYAHDAVVGEAFDRGLVDDTEWKDLSLRDKTRLCNWWTEMKKRHSTAR